MRSLFLFLVCLPLLLTSQVTIGTNTLPEVGDSLEYTLITNTDINNSYRLEGAGLTWNYQGLEGSATTKEYYRDIRQTDLSDTFPDANMLIDFLGFRTAAIRSNNKIDLIGFEFGGFDGLGIALNTVLDRPFTLRTVPLNYNDRYDDEFDVVIGLNTSLIPGLDSIMIPGGGGNTIDTIRITTTIIKLEHVNAWGTLNINDQSYDVLKVEQSDSTSTKIEVGFPVFGQIVWIDATAFLGDFVSNFNRATTTHKFLTPDSKRSILEFREGVMIDTSGTSSTFTTVRMSTSIMTSTEEIETQRLDVYPNPTSSILNLGQTVNGVLRVMNMQGEIVVIHTDFNANHINVGDIPAGIYMIDVQNQTQHFQTKFIRR